MTFKNIKLENQKNIWTLTISRPESLNALNSETLNELSQAIDDIGNKKLNEAQVLIVTGAGEKAFVAGADIKEMNGLTPEQAKAFAEKGQGIFRKLENLKIPTIAAVNGFALGGGLELALACDFIYASENAKLGLPEVSLGLLPGFGGTVRLARAMGLPAAKEWIFSAGVMPAEYALKLGLVNRIFLLVDLLPEVRKTAELIASRSPVAISMAKKSMMNAYDLDIDSAMAAEASHFAGLFSTGDFKEGTEAFIQKRKPDFKGH
jgi:enoyl-CoA hydratase